MIFNRPRRILYVPIERVKSIYRAREIKEEGGGKGGNICLVIRDGVNTVRFLN